LKKPDETISSMSVESGSILLPIDENCSLASSLDNYFFNCKVDYNTEELHDVGKLSGYEKLPQILCFNLIRTNFDKVTQKQTKVNSKITFNDTIIMDRYLHENKSMVLNNFKPIQNATKERRKRELIVEEKKIGKHSN